MDLSKISEQITSSLNEWLKHKGKVVVGLDGYSGIGKTTLLKYLAEKNKRIKPLFMDDFVTTANTKEKLLSQIENSSPSLSLEWRDHKGFEKIRDLIKEFKDQDTKHNILLLEGIFLFHPEVLNDVWDKRIFIDGNIGEADERRIKREKERWGLDYFPETHPDSYARLFKIAWARYLKLNNPMAKADLVIKID